MAPERGPIRGRAGELAGRRVALTRMKSQARSLAEGLEALGAEVSVHPLIRVEPLDPSPAERTALTRPGAYDWIVFTSPNSVAAYFKALEALEAAGPEGEGAGLSNLQSARVAAIGPATSAALRERGVGVDLEPPEAHSESLAAALPAGPGVRFLLPRSAQGSAVLPNALQAEGAEVTVASLYRTAPDPKGAAALRSALQAGRVDALVLASGSAVRSLKSALGDEAGPLTRRTAVVCIGPVTAGHARREGMEVAAVARPHTASGIIEAVRSLWRRRPGSD